MARVLHICTSAEFWGFVRPLLTGLVEVGHEVHLASAFGPELIDLSQKIGMTTHALPIRREIHVGKDAQTLLELTRLVRRVRPDIVHSHTPKAGLLGTVSGRVGYGPLCVYQMHGLRYETATGSRRRVLRAAEQVSCGLAHEVVCVSRSLREQAIRDGVLSGAKSRVIGAGSVAGVDLDYFERRAAKVLGEALRRRCGIPPSGIVVGFAGRLAKDKGLNELAHAWPEVHQRFPRAHLILAGGSDPTDPVNLEALADRPEVRFLGHLEDIRPFLGLCSLLVLPSYREGLPQVLLEASAVETPFVATRVTGVLDAVSSEHQGWLVPPRDHRALAKSVMEALSLVERGLSWGPQLRDFVASRFGQEAVLSANLAFYDQLLHRIARPPHSK